MKFKTHILIICLSLGIVPCVTSADYFSSISGLEQILNTEKILLSDLRLQMETLKRYFNLIESEIHTIGLEHNLADQDTENYLTNPLNIYRLIKRLNIDWDTLASHVTQIRNNLFFDKKMGVHRVSLNFPSKEDIEGSALAITRVQSVYKLDVSQLAAGVLNGVKYGTAMSWRDCFVLGQHLFGLEDYNNTRIWLHESMERLRHEKSFIEESTLNTMELVANNLYELGDFDIAYEISQRVLEYDPKRIRDWHLGDKAARGVDFIKVITSNEHNSYSSTDEFSQYERVCRGETVPTERQLRNLRCRFITNGHPYRLLARIKMEEHNIDPFIVTFHDMINLKNIETLKEIAAPHMTRSTVNPIKNGENSKKSSFRVSKNAWLNYGTHSFMQDMLRDLHDATGLELSYRTINNYTKSVEPLQVANYGVGGHYEPHWDFFRDNNLYPAEEGNRIATAIFYLSDVEQGGATAFPFLNFAVKPQKGNVLFWYNLHRSLDLDFRTKHAGCPVLKGSKWIGNVWIHETAQTFTRPCEISRDNAVSLKYEIIK